MLKTLELPSAILLLDPSGHVVSCDASAERLHGHSASEIVGKHFSVLYPPEEIAAGTPQSQLTTLRHGDSVEDEGWRLRKDGSRFWAAVVITALHGADGKLLGFTNVIHELTAPRAAKESDQEPSVERYRALSRKLEVILESVADGITVQDPTGKLLFANTAAARACGFSSVDELLAATPAEIVARFVILDENAQPVTFDRLPGRRALRTGEPASMMLRVRNRASDQESWSFVQASAVLGSDGKPELAVNIWHDVSADRRREEHEHYLTKATGALSSSLDYTSMLSTLAGLLVPGLADWCSVQLLEDDELKNVAVAHVDPAKLAFAKEYQQKYPPNRQQARGTWNVVRTGQSELYDNISDELLAQGARDQEHLRLLRTLGMTSVIVVPIRIRDQVSGTITLVSAEGRRHYDRNDLALAEELGRRAGVCIDNARLYAAEKTTREQLELLAQAGKSFSGAFDYEQILRSVVDLSLPILADFAFFDVKEGANVRRIAAAHDDHEIDQLIKQTQWVRSERMDKNLCALSSGRIAYHPRIDDAWLQDVATSDQHLGLLRQLRLCSMVSVPLWTRDELLGSLTLCFGKSGRHHSQQDTRLAEELAGRAAVAVMQARLYEQAQAAATRAEEASRIKDEFLATVSHELRTPLHAIVGWSSLLSERVTDPGLVKGVEVIHRNAHAQAKIIEDILDVSRIITGNLRLELGAGDLADTIRNAMEVVAPSAAAKHIRLSFVPPSEPIALVADHERLQQVVWNLLSNAVKFTDSGGTITVSIERAAQLSLSVVDTGRGIDPDFLPYVFDRFKQADSSSTRRVGGLGLGLAIVRHLVELHGGRVTAHSEGPGQGATFTVVLPTQAVALPAEVLEYPVSDSTAHPIAPRGASLHGLKVLVVDDEQDARELLQTVLVQAGASVVVAASAAEGLESLQRDPPHVLVSDIGMPGEDGYAFMRRIRALDPQRFGNIPSIALTAYTRGVDRTKALAEGFTTHIAKPVSPDDLVTAVANLARFSGIGDHRSKLA